MSAPGADVRRGLLAANEDRVLHFARRCYERAQAGDARRLAIVLLDVDDPRGAGLAEVLMPEHDWQPYRERGETPVARGLCPLDALCAWVEEHHSHAAAKRLRRTPAGEVPVLVVAGGDGVLTAYTRFPTARPS